MICILINEKVATRNIDNADLDQNGHSDMSDHEHGPERHDETKLQTVVAQNGRSEVPAPQQTRGQQTAELVGKIASALDPEAQRVRDEE